MSTHLESERKLFRLNYSMREYKKAYGHFKKYRSLITREEMDAEYKNDLIKVFISATYEELLDDAEYAGFIREIQEIFKPEKASERRVCNGRLFRKLRVGFVSFDLHTHPVGIFILALFKDKLSFSSVEYYAYHTKEKTADFVTETIEKEVDVYRNAAGLSDGALKKLIMQDEIDILFDLNGFSTGMRPHLFAERAAPVQITWIGFPATSAVPNMDYVIADETTDPRGKSDKYYSERILYMDKTFLCFPIDTDDADVAPEPPFVKNGYITFGTFNKSLKYSDRTLRMWKRVLDGVPGSRLYMQPGDIKTESDFDALKSRLASFGIDGGTVDFGKKMPYNEYYAAHNNVDIILDTYPFCGATTTCDAFSMSVPVVSLCGKRHAERVGAAMQSHAGISDLTAFSEDEYAEKAVALANSPQRLISLKKDLRKRFLASPLADTGAFKKEFENKLRTVYAEFVAASPQACAKKDENELPLLYNEAITSVYYLKYLLSGEGVPFMDEALREFTELHLFLCRTLQNIYSGDKKAEEVLREYKKLVYMLKKGVDAQKFEQVGGAIMRDLRFFDI